MNVGHGQACSHHGELVQGVFLDTRGHRRRALVTVPVLHRRAHAEFRPDSHGLFTVTPGDRTKALDAARLTAAFCTAGAARTTPGGHLRLHGDVPVGIGMGSSTSDTIATIRAVAASFDTTLAPERIAALAVQAERACDPVMLDERPRLFAQREGRVLEELGAALPAVIILGCITGGGEPVDTLGFDRAAPPEDEVYAFEHLRSLLRNAVAESDAAQLGRVCTISARYNQRILPKEELPELERIADREGAAGVQVAHSGNVAGLVFDAAVPDIDDRLRRAARLLESSGIPVTGHFRIGTTSWERDHGRPRRRRHRASRPDPASRQPRLPAL
ncbi:GHMP kinase [Prauserella alba]|uniref:GHMP kinase N-terminal domain-containing protein n=1 Tax=Prauserella alba TaxID=176898 RepID=A0ABN1V7Y1_9PSEU|nr:GHMP kinase [Prauserella alba]MCP2181341.1 threonine kinase [Prauserella alba]